MPHSHYCQGRNVSAMRRVNWGECEATVEVLRHVQNNLKVGDLKTCLSHEYVLQSPVDTMKSTSDSVAIMLPLLSWTSDWKHQSSSRRISLTRGLCHYSRTCRSSTCGNIHRETS